MDAYIQLAKQLHRSNKLPADLSREDYSPEDLFLTAYASFLMGIANKNTRVRYRTAVNQFIRYMHNARNRTPLEATGIDISVYRDDLLRTGGVMSVARGDDLSRCWPQARTSVENKTSILSAFFKFLMKPGMDGSPPLMNQNPVLSLHTRFKIDQYGNSKKIDTDVFKRCIDSINQESVKGKRDYALLFGYYMTGRRNSELVNIRWGDINFNRNPPTYRFLRKGEKETTDEMPPSLLAAIKRYLEARYGPEYKSQLRPDSYIFTAMPGKGGTKQKEDPNTPLTERFVLKLVKDLAKQAGISAKDITVHSLRHLHAENYLSAGASVEEVRARLWHENLATTQRYVSKMNNEKNRLADKLEEMLDE